VAAGDLSGDLDAILARALAPDWHDRYPSVEALAADLRAWKSGRVVNARGGGWLYAAAKFARRNAVVTAAATVAVVALLAAIVVLAQLWTVTRGERDRANRQLSAVRTLAQSLFTAEEQLAATSGTTAVRRLLADSLNEYLAAVDLGSDRQLLLDTARAYKQVGDIEGNPNEPNLGNPRRALAHYDRSVEILERLRAGADDPQINAALASTLAARADVYLTRGEWDRADRGYTQALALASRMPTANAPRPDDQELLAGIHRSSGDLRMARDDAAGALSHYQNALALQQAAAALGNSPERRRRTALTQIRLGDTEAAGGAMGRAQQHYAEAARTLQSLSADLGPRRDLLRDTALGFARLGRIQQGADAHAGRREMDRALEMLRGLTASDPADARTLRDLMVTLTQYSDLVARTDTIAARAALDEARRIGRTLMTLAPDDPERARELASVEDRLRSGGLAAVALRLTRMNGPTQQIEPGGEPLRIGDHLRVSATAPPGWGRYLLVFGPDGPAQVLDEAAMNAARWTLPVGPAPSQTVLLVTLPRTLTSGERQRLAVSIEGAAGPKVVDFDSHIVWTDRTDRLDSVATARGIRDTRWVADVQKRLAALGDFRLTGRTFPVAPGLP
jgi:tetratricopeptide (TPR) repeat protein